MDPIDSLFSDVKLSKEDSNAVRGLLKIIKPPKEFVNHLYKIRDARESWLSMDIWREAFPNFPLVFVTNSNEGLKGFDKFSNFWKLKNRQQLVQLMRTLVLSLEAEAGGRPIGWLFRLPYIDEWIVMHNGDVPGPDDQSSVYMRISPDDLPPYDRFVVIEGFSDYLARHRSYIQDFFADGLWN